MEIFTAHYPNESLFANTQIKAPPPLPVTVKHNMFILTSGSGVWLPDILTSKLLIYTSDLRVLIMNQDGREQKVYAFDSTSLYSLLALDNFVIFKNFENKVKSLVSSLFPWLH